MTGAPATTTRRHPVLRAAAALAAAVLGLAACSAGDEGTEQAAGPDAFAAAPKDGVLTRSYAGTIDLEVHGAVEAAWSGAVPIQVTTLVSPDVEPSGWLLQVGLLDAVDAGGGWSVRPAFDVTGYTGDGTYEVGVAGANDLGLESDAFLVIGGNGNEPAMYRDALEACTIESRDMGARGTVSCPATTGPLGQISFQWSWEGGELLKSQDGSGSDVPLPASGTEPGASAQGSAAAPGATTTTAGGAEPASEPPADEPPAEPLDLVVALSAQCVMPGGLLTVTIDTGVAESAVAAAVAFSDARTYGLHRIATADGAGRVVWEVTIPPEAPEGEANVLVSASSPDGKRGGSTMQPFAVKLVGC